MASALYLVVLDSRRIDESGDILTSANVHLRLQWYVRHITNIGERF